MKAMRIVGEMEEAGLALEGREGERSETERAGGASPAGVESVESRNDVQTPRFQKRRPVGDIPQRTSLKSCARWTAAVSRARPVPCCAERVYIPR